MRISDWSSDVCSSDLRCEGRNAMMKLAGIGILAIGALASAAFAERVCFTIYENNDGADLTGLELWLDVTDGGTFAHIEFKIGRATCRERVCQYGEITGVDVELQKKKERKEERK